MSTYFYLECPGCREFVGAATTAGPSFLSDALKENALARFVIRHTYCGFGGHLRAVSEHDHPEERGFVRFEKGSETWEKIY